MQLSGVRAASVTVRTRVDEGGVRRRELHCLCQRRQRLRLGGGRVGAVEGRHAHGAKTQARHTQALRSEKFRHFAWQTVGRWQSGVMIAGNCLARRGRVTPSCHAIVRLFHVLSITLVSIV
jgi:hypothetical protein